MRSLRDLRRKAIAKKCVLVLVVGLSACVFAAPAWCDTSFQFSTSALAGGAITANGTTLDSLSGVNFNTVTITDSPLDPNGALTYAITGGSFSLSAATS